MGDCELSYFYDGQATLLICYRDQRSSSSAKRKDGGSYIEISEKTTTSPLGNQPGYQRGASSKRASLHSLSPTARRSPERTRPTHPTSRFILRILFPSLRPASLSWITPRMDRTSSTSRRECRCEFSRDIIIVRLPLSYASLADSAFLGSYAIKEDTGERGWIPSWFVNKPTGRRDEASPTTPTTTGSAGLDKQRTGSAPLSSVAEGEGRLNGLMI